MKQVTVKEFLQTVAVRPMTLNLFFRRLGPLPSPPFINDNIWRLQINWENREGEVTDTKCQALLGKYQQGNNIYLQMPNVASCIVNDLLGCAAGIHWDDIVTH